MNLPHLFEFRAMKAKSNTDHVWFNFYQFFGHSVRFCHLASFDNFNYFGRYLASFGSFLHKGTLKMRQTTHARRDKRLVGRGVNRLWLS